MDTNRHGEREAGEEDWSRYCISENATRKLVTFCAKQKQ